MSVRTRRKLTRRTKDAEDLVVGLTSLMANGDFNAADPRITAYLKDKPTVQISDSLDEVEGMLAHPTGLLDPGLLASIRDALVASFADRVCADLRAAARAARKVRPVDSEGAGAD